MSCCNTPPPHPCTVTRMASGRCHIWEISSRSHQTNLNWDGSLSMSSRTMVTGALNRAQPSVPHLYPVSFCWAGDLLLKGGSVLSRNLWFQDLNSLLELALEELPVLPPWKESFSVLSAWGWRAACEGVGWGRRWGVCIGS